MKKGLITAVGAMMLAIAGSGYANAPTISGIPDVVISDAEDNAQVVGATVDLNFFRYLNAFNILTYAKDSDTTPDLLKFAFQEENSVNNLTINGATQQLGSPMPAPSSWTNKIGTSGANSFWFSFRDILRSPTGRAQGDPIYTTPFNAFGDPKRANGSTVTSATDELLPWSTTNLTTLGTATVRTVKIWVGDEADNTASDVINVYSRNKGADALSGTFTTIFSDNKFMSANWDFTQSVFTQFAVPTSSGAGGAGFLGLQGGATAGSAKSGAYYAQWIQHTTANVAPLDFVETPNTIYAAKFHLELSAVANNNKGQAPMLRLGVEDALQQLVTMNLLQSEDGSMTNTPDTYNPQLPAVGVGNGKDYGLYWSPMSYLPEINQEKSVFGVDWRRFRLFLDMDDADVTAPATIEDSGTWRLTNVEVYTLPRPDTLAVVAGSSTSFKITDFTSNTRNANGAGWQTSPGFAPNAATITPSGGMLQFHANAGAGGNSTLPYALYERKDTTPWIANKIVRVTARLSCPTATDRTTFGIARIRHQMVGAWLSQTLVIARNPALNGAPGVTGVPMMPDTIANAPTGTPYEVYVPSYGGPNAFITSITGLNGYNTSYWIMGLDHLALNNASAASNWTVHEVQVEVLADPVGIN